MKAYVAVTDDRWFRFLRDRKPQTVNFWRPSAEHRFRALSVGEPFLFKLHAPNNYIVGGGFFDHFSIQPVSIAWERYGQSNGVATLLEMRRSIERYRRLPDKSSSDYEIGCVILTLPFFFKDSRFLPVPEDFHPNTVQGRTYDINRGPGRELWESVRANRQLTNERLG